MKSSRFLLFAFVAVLALATSCGQVKDIAYFQNKIVDNNAVDAVKVIYGERK